MAEGMEVLRRAKIGRDRKLIHHGVPLTSERLRAVIDCAILQASGLAANTIVAGGRQACDPHERGHGPLRANEPIIIDIFPRSQKTGYFGDITRTVVRGRASEAVRKLYDTVLRGQKIALRKNPRRRCQRRTFTKPCSNFLFSKATKPDGATAAWKASSTARATASAWKSMKRRAWAPPPPDELRPATSSPLSRGFITPKSAVCGWKTSRSSPATARAT